MTEAELVRLLDVARERPICEAMTIRTRKRRGQIVGSVRPEVEERLRRLGLEQSLMHETMDLTGLRRDELAYSRVSKRELTRPYPGSTCPAT